MAGLIYQALYIFFVVLELLLFLFIFSTWLPAGNRITAFLYVLVEPMLVPIRFLLKRSVFQARGDLSPIIAFVVLTFLQNFFYGIK